MAQNYYVVLGIKTNATLDEIKSAYRQRVMEFHPDHYGENHAPFLAVQEAYAILSDPQQRKQYDHSMQQRSSPPITEIKSRSTYVEPLIPEERRPDIQDVSMTRSFDTFFPSFDELFDRLWSNFSGRPRPKSDDIKSLTMEIPITSVQAARGGMFRILVPMQRTCTACHGYGGVGPYECWHCSGEGKITKEFPISVSLPGGISNQYIVRIPLDQYGISNFYLTIIFRITDQI